MVAGLLWLAPVDWKNIRRDSLLMWVPSYWPMKMVWQAADGLPYAPYLIAGLAVNVVAVGLLMRRFERIVHR